MQYNKKDKADEQVFAEVYAATQSPTQAMLAAQPNLITRKKYASVKADRLLKKTDVQTKIQKKLETMSVNASKRIKELIDSNNESIATTNAWKVIEHVRGTPTHRSINLNASVSIEDALFDED